MALASTCVQIANATVGEGPLWDEKQQALWWFDVRQKRIFLYSPEYGQVGQWWLASQIFALSLTDRGELVVALEDGIYVYSPETEALRRLGSLVHGAGATRFNDGKVDPSGRFWVGTRDLERATPTGAFYAVSSDGSYEVKLTGVRGSNGLGWTADGKTMFYTDSSRKIIWSFDFKTDDGSLESRRVFVTIREAGVAPDGLCVDTDGCVWCALFGGGAVVRYDPHGVEMERVKLPVPYPTSCAFGGQSGKTLFVTTESYRLSARILSEYPLSGGLFAVDSQSTGVMIGRFNTNA